jgi:hypothetical protein
MEPAGHTVAALPVNILADTAKASARAPTADRTPADDPLVVQSRWAGHPDPHTNVVGRRSAALDVGADRRQATDQIVVPAVDVVDTGDLGLALGGQSGDDHRRTGSDVVRPHRRAG